MTSQSNGASSGADSWHSWREYAQRMNRVIDHIDRHLAGTVDLASIADVANFSPYHFHRLFLAWMGETLGDYVRRRRLEAGALMLNHQRHTPVLNIALDVGFGSSEAFSRAFKQHFGMTPSDWRKSAPARREASLAAQRNPDQVESKRDQVPVERTGNDGEPFFEEPIMNITIATLAPVRVAYMRHIGPYGPSISRFWQEQFLPWRHANGLEQASCYGIGYDDPDVTPPSKCRYDACVVVPEEFVAHAPVSIATLPGGRYAVADFRGDGPAIGGAWIELLRRWLPSSGMQPDSRPFFEYYPADAYYDAASGTMECQLCVPVRPL